MSLVCLTIEALLSKTMLMSAACCDYPSRPVHFNRECSTVDQGPRGRIRQLGHEWEVPNSGRRVRIWYWFGGTGNDWIDRYQPGGASGYKPETGVDPLSNGTNCLRDAAIMQKLGVNTIRVYNLDPKINHDACASIFNGVGIYMMLDVNSPLPNESLNRGDPGSSYSSAYLERIFEVVEAFKDYPNTLGFFGSNEVINDGPSGAAVPPYARAVTRDLKNYIAKHSSRSIPVGYSAADVQELLVDTWAYLQCSVNSTTSDTSRIDFFGLNSYSWCGSDATYTSSRYDQLVAKFINTTVPVFFSEFGCNKPSPRVWNEIQALYSPQMTVVMSGGLAYEYTQDASNNYGLVVVNDNGTVTLRPDFDNLQSQLNKLDIKALQSANSTATSLKAPVCSNDLISSSTFSKGFETPDVPQGGQDLIDNGVKNPQNGKLVKVTDTNVPVAVYASDGSEIKGLAIKLLPDDQSNSPNGQDTSRTATENSSGTAAASPTKTSGKSRRAEIGSLVGLLGVALFFVLVL